MRLMDTAELNLVEDGLSRVVADAETSTIALRLARFGWFSLFDDEPGTATRLLFRQCGIHATDICGLTLVMGRVLGVPASTHVDDEARTALVLPAPGSAACPGRSLESIHDVSVDGVVLGGHADRFLVMADVAGQQLFGEWTAPAGAVQPLGGLDPDLGLRRVQGRGAFTPTQPDTTLGPLEAWQQAVAVGRLGLASELTAIGDRVLRASVDYVTTRRQFGRALGSFQAVQHHLAEAEVDLAVARSAVLEAADHTGPLEAALAKLLAGRAATRATGRAQQVLGGIGFTWEHRLHRDVRRVIALDTLLGTTAGLEREVGAILQTQSDLPRLASL
jgi:Acyl-CoA dehydrogenase, C-terminal domain